MQEAMSPLIIKPAVTATVRCRRALELTRTHKLARTQATQERALMEMLEEAQLAAAKQVSHP
jgi:hypothetical protein